MVLTDMDLFSGGVTGVFWPEALLWETRGYIWLFCALCLLALLCKMKG